MTIMTRHHLLRIERVDCIRDLLSDGTPRRTALPSVAFDQGGQGLRTHDRKRCLEITTKHPALPLLIEFAHLLLDMHRIDIDDACASGKAARALEFKGADAYRHDRSYEARLFEGLLSSDLMRREARNRISLGYDPLAAATTGHQIQVEFAICGKLNGEGGNLAIHGNSGTHRDSLRLSA